MKHKTWVLWIAMLMIVPVALVLPARADVPGSPPPSGRADASDLLDPITGYATSGSFTPRYPGDAIDFYIRVTTVYSGALFTGPDSPGNQTRINRARLSVEGFTDANKAPIANPVDWEVSTFNNGYGGGYNWSSPGNTYSLYATQTNGYFRFTIKTSNVLPGQYYLSLKVTADIMTTARYDNMLYTYVCTFDKVTNYDYVPFEVRSYVAPTSAGKYSFIGMAENGNSEPLYAGAQNQKIGFTGMYSYSGTLTDITGEISFTTGSFTVVQSTSFAKQSGMNLYWRINIDKQTSPGNHNFNLRFTYTRNGVDITEASTVQSIMVPYTPLLAFPSYNYNPRTVFTELVQNAPNATFRVPVRNDGNVDLKDVTVRLDLDNAAFFVNNDFYYSETWYSTVTYIDTAKYVGTIEAGKSIDVAFPDVPLKNNLPPGRYFIPIDYEASYYSDGSVISSGDVISGSWDEKGYYDYTNIMQATSSPEIPVEISPGILINVVDDARGIELEGQLTSTYNPGQRNAYFGLTVYNREQYSFTETKYTIHTDGGSPLKNQGAPDADPQPTLPPLKRAALYDGSSDGVYFYADIKDTAGGGIRHFTVDFEGRNPFYEKVLTTFDVALTLNAVLPNIQSIRSSVDAGGSGSGTVSVTIKNFGLGGAHNLSAFFKPSSPTLRALDDIITIGDLPPERTAALTIRVGPATPSASIYGTWSGYIYYQYTDDAGGFNKFYGGASEYITFVFQPKMADLVITDVECPQVLAKQTFNVKITVTNVGGSPAQNASAMLVNPNTVFVVKGDKTSDLGTIAPGESQSVSFQVTAASDITDATSYSMWLYFSYRRVDGNTLTYSEGDHESFSIRTKDTIQTTKQEQVVEYKAGTSQSTVDFGAIILGVLILIGMIIIARTFRRPAPPAPPQPLPPQPSMMVPHPPPPPQMEQQYAQPPYIQPPTQ